MWSVNGLARRTTADAEAMVREKTKKTAEKKRSDMDWVWVGGARSFLVLPD
jgi:hypothetical protein